LAIADRHALAVLAARPRRAHGEVVAHHVNVAQHLGTIADEVGVPEGLGDLPAFDEVRLGHPEHEVSGRRVDLTAPELGHIHA
jgi:hypothetical protein